MEKLASKERDEIFKGILSESYNFMKRKDYENAFKSTSKANLFLNCFTDDPLLYLLNLSKVRGIQADICFNEKPAHFDYYLVFYLESFAIDIAKDLLSFPFHYGFYYRKEIQATIFSDYCNENMEISLDEDDNFSIALKKLNIFQFRNEIGKEYNNFLYEELPSIYGIPSGFNKNTLKESDNWQVEERINLISVLPEVLKKKSIGVLPYEINKFVTQLLKKYYERGNISI